MMKELHSSTHGVFLDLLNSPIQPYTLSKARAAIGVVGPDRPEGMPVEDGGHRIAKRVMMQLHVHCDHILSKEKIDSIIIAWTNIVLYHIYCELFPGCIRTIRETRHII